MPASLEGAVEQLTRGADERMTGEVLRVARLLADEHDSASRGPSPKTVCVPRLYRSHALHSAATARTAASVGRSGSRSRTGSPGRLHPLRAPERTPLSHELLHRPRDVLRDERVVACRPRALERTAPRASSPLLPIATARLRRSRRTPARFIALPFSSARSSSSDARHRSSSRGPSSPRAAARPDPP